MTQAIEFATPSLEHLSPQQSQHLMGLRRLGLEDLPRWKQALEQAQPKGFGCYFAYVLAHQGSRRSTVLVGEDGGSLCCYMLRERRRGPLLDVYLPPMPMDVSIAQRCLERANGFNGNRSARILRIDESEAPRAMQIPGLKVRERRKQYLYAPKAYADLSGKKYQTLRHHLAKIEKRTDIETAPYSDRFAAPCRELLQQWSERYRQTFGKSGGAGLSKRVLALADVLSAPDLTGEVTLLGDRLVGYWLGGQLRPGLGCFVDGKSDLDVPGLGYFQRYRFLTTHDSFELVNDGSDARRSGLRQLKSSLRPAAMHIEYRGIQETA